MQSKAMSRKSMDMTTGSPLKQIVLFGLPILVGNIFQQLYSMVDSIVVGKFVSAGALAAVGATGRIAHGGHGIDHRIDHLLGLLTGGCRIIQINHGINPTVPEFPWLPNECRQLPEHS